MAYFVRISLVKMGMPWHMVSWYALPSVIGVVSLHADCMLLHAGGLRVPTAVLSSAKPPQQRASLYYHLPTVDLSQM